MKICIALLLLVFPYLSISWAEEPVALKFEFLGSIQGTEQWDWWQARTAFVPGEQPMWLTTMSQTGKAGTHDFHDILQSFSRDGGRTWTEPAAVPSLKRTRQDDGFEIAPGDLWPTFHAKTGKILVTGKTFNFEDGKREIRLRERVSYAVMDPATEKWGPLRLLEVPEKDHSGATITGANAGCTQRVDLPNGDVLLPIRYWRDPKVHRYTSVVARCSFDGETLTYQEHGSEHTIDSGRGLYEPSLIEFGGRYFLTLRANGSAYVTKGTDGIHFEPIREWTFDDGKVLGSYNTQQHWVTVGGGLFLVYTRRGADNDHMMRHRAPLFIGQVNPETLRVIRSTERILIPENHATLGNSGVCRISDNESWVTCGEGLLRVGKRKGELNQVFHVRITAQPHHAFRGGENPAAQGWTEELDAGESAPGKLVGKAWRIEDDDDSGPEWRSYEVNLSDDERDRARREGFTYHWRVRIPQESGQPTRAIGTEVALQRKDGSGKLRFAVQMGRRGDELLARFHRGPSGHVETGARVVDADGFHDWELAFDGETQTINLRVDGQLLMAERCEHEDHGPHLLFGSRATGTGVAEWERVEFVTGKPDRELTPVSEPPFVTPVYVSRQDGYHTYRAPALVVSKNGTLLAFAHGRKESVHDMGNQDMVLKRSSNGGETWSEMSILRDEGKSTVSTPSPVVDRETGRIILVFHRDARQILTMHSDDDGLTWSDPVEITDQVSSPDWGFRPTAPGIGIQIQSGEHAGRIVIPAYYRLTLHKGSTPYAYVMFSDDGGMTWSYGETMGPETCEAQVAETAGGGLIMNARNHWARTGGRPDLSGKRIVARSDDGGATWEEPFFDHALIEPTCQAGLLRYSFARDGDPQSRSRLLFANPADVPTSNHGGPRRRLTVRMSYDEGHTWPVSRLVDNGVTAYSTLARLPDGRVGMIYESGGYARLTFVAFDLKWLGEEVAE